MSEILYHGTPSDRFYEMIKMGRIEVSSKVKKTYIKPDMYAVKTYYLAQREDSFKVSVIQLLTDEETGLAKIDAELREHMDNLHTRIELNMKIQSGLEGRKLRKAIWLKYANTEIRVDLSLGNPTEDIVYLANREKAIQYARGFLVKFRGLEFDEYYSNEHKRFGVVLILDVDEENLSPDLNDGRVLKNIEPEWKQTYGSIGQCVHNGEIGVSRIKGVVFVLPDSMGLSAYECVTFNKIYNYHEASSIVSKYEQDISRMKRAVQFREELSKEG